MLTLDKAAARGNLIMSDPGIKELLCVQWRRVLDVAMRQELVFKLETMETCQAARMADFSDHPEAELVERLRRVRLSDYDLDADHSSIAYLTARGIACDTQPLLRPPSAQLASDSSVIMAPK